jgi:CarD family transcriptional regulator
MGGDSMFRVGEKVVHPVHGAGTVSRIEERSGDGGVELYYVIPDALAACELMIPVSTAGDIGLRPALAQSSTEEIFAAIRESGKNGARVEGGEYVPPDHTQTVGLARTLGRLLYKQRSGAISQAERKQLERVRRLVVGELSLVTGHAEARVAALIESCVIAVPGSPAAEKATKSRK